MSGDTKPIGVLTVDDRALLRERVDALVIAELRYRLTRRLSCRQKSVSGRGGQRRATTVIKPLGRIVGYALSGPLSHIVLTRYAGIGWHDLLVPDR
jgi:hypothetical protein